MAKKKKLVKKLDTGWVKVDVSKLVPAKWNYKEDDDVLDEKLEAGMKRNGVVQNLIIRQMPKGKFEVVNGNHRLAILQRMGQKKVMCFNLGKISLAEAKRISYETNEINYATDQIKLAELIADLTKSFEFDDILSTSPFDEDLLKGMIEAPAFDASQYDGEAPAEDPEGEQESGIRTLKFEVTREVYQEFMSELTRYKASIFPDQDPKECPASDGIAAMLAVCKTAKLSK